MEKQSSILSDDEDTNYEQLAEDDVGALPQGLNLIVDDREPALIAALGDRPDVSVLRLAVGDIHIVRVRGHGLARKETVEMVIEMKVKGDLEASLVDDRAENQWERMRVASEKDGFAIMYLLVGCGSLLLGHGGSAQARPGLVMPPKYKAAHRDGDMLRASIQTFIFKKMMNHGAAIHHTRDIAETAAFLIRVITDAGFIEMWPCGVALGQKAVRKRRASIDYLRKDDNRRYLDAFVHRSTRGALTPHQRTVAMYVQSGMNEANAVALARAYPTMRDFTEFIRLNETDIETDFSLYRDGASKRLRSMDPIANLHRDDAGKVAVSARKKWMSLDDAPDSDDGDDDARISKHTQDMANGSVRAFIAGAVCYDRDALISADDLYGGYQKHVSHVGAPTDKRATREIFQREFADAPLIDLPRIEGERDPKERMRDIKKHTYSGTAWPLRISAIEHHHVGGAGDGAEGTGKRRIGKISAMRAVAAVMGVAL